MVRYGQHLLWFKKNAKLKKQNQQQTKWVWIGLGFEMGCLQCQYTVLSFLKFGGISPEF
jgi:hypothetical protein